MDKNSEKNFQLAILGILLGLVGIIISLLTPAIQTFVNWSQGTASDTEIVVAFFYVGLASVLAFIEFKVSRNILVQKKEEKKLTKEKPLSKEIVLAIVAIIITLLMGGYNSL